MADIQEETQVTRTGGIGGGPGTRDHDSLGAGTEGTGD